MLFEWDKHKRAASLSKHHIDFEDAKHIFEGPVFESVQHRGGEDRTLAIGRLEGIEIVVVYTVRGNRRRIISARRAHRSERQDYANQLEHAQEREDGF